MFLFASTPVPLIFCDFFFFFCDFFSLVLEQSPPRSNAHNGRRHGQHNQGKRTLMLKAFGLTLLAIEFSSDLLEQLV